MDAKELTALILSAATPSAICAAISALHSHLLLRPPDLLRPFFSSAFPALLSMLFAFHDPPSSPSPPAWIDSAPSSGDHDFSGKLFDLLAPSGVLLSSISAADRHSLVKYVFPPERLPEWMKALLLSKSDCRVLRDLCPLFRDRIKEDSIQGSYQLQLNIFEYYMFWFAYYPVHKSSCEGSDGSGAKKSRRSRFEKWTTSLPLFSASSSSRASGENVECSLYMRLLRAYLRAYVPNVGSSVCQPYRSSLFHSSLEYDESVQLRAEFFVHTLVQFWLVDNDFLPVPANVCRSFGVSFPFRAALGDTPPAAGLGKVVRLLVEYLNCDDSLIEGKECSDLVEYSGGWRGHGDMVNSSICWGKSPGSWKAVIQRPLYRFILRTFLFCPIGVSMNNVSRVFSVWTSYIEPWKLCSEKYTGSDELQDQSAQAKNNGMTNERKKEAVYSPSWQGYVVSNYPFYSHMVMHFFGFGHKFITSNPEIIMKMVLKLLSILTSSRELMELLKKVDSAYHSSPAGAFAPMSDDSYKFIPTIRSQLQDWEDGLCESEGDGYLPDNWNKDFKLFSGGEDGGHHLLQLLILRAEAETKAISGDSITQFLKALDSVKTQTSKLFGSPNAEKPQSASPEDSGGHHGRKEVFTPKQIWADVKYKGDLMRGPIGNSEVAWLARLLVQVSDWLNQNLGLDQHGSEANQAGGDCACVDLPKGEVVHVTGFWQAAYTVLSFMISSVLVLLQAGIRYAGQRGWRINLRVLASKKVVAALIFYVMISALKRAFGLASHSHFLLSTLL